MFKKNFQISSGAANPGRPALFGPTISVYRKFIEGRMVIGGIKGISKMFKNDFQKSLSHILFRTLSQYSGAFCFV